MDDVNRRGLAVSPMPEAAQWRLLERVPFAPARNPIDVTGQFLINASLLDQAIELAATSGDYRSLASFQDPIGRTSPNGSDPCHLERAKACKP